MNHIEQIAQDVRVRGALASFRTRQHENLSLIKAVQQIPAPTFEEARRASFIEEQMTALGLEDVQQDARHNVYGRFPGQQSQAPIVVSAHLDTVFPLETDLTVKENGRFIYGPGIGDNSTGVAGLLLIARALQEFDLRPANDIWFVANVCEEGLGDLRGMRAVVERFGPSASYIIVEGGLFGQLSHQAIGVRRFRVAVNGPGGHSWGSFGATSAIHVLGRIIVAIDDLRVPEKPRTTFNVGVIEGGTTVNSIAQSAAFLLDLRSEDGGVLDQLVGSVAEIVEKANQIYGNAGIEVSMSPIGHRPAGQISRRARLVVLAQDALHFVGCTAINFMKGSTDANIPLSQGITAVCLGLTESGNAHRLDEYIDPAHLPDGLSQLLLLTLAAAGFPS